MKIRNFGKNHAYTGRYMWYRILRISYIYSFKKTLYVYEIVQSIYNMQMNCINRVLIKCEIDH